MDSKNKLVISLLDTISKTAVRHLIVHSMQTRQRSDIKFYWLRRRSREKVQKIHTHSRVTSGGKFFCWSCLLWLAAARDNKTCKGRSCVCLNNSIISFARATTTLKAPRGALTPRASSYLKEHSLGAVDISLTRSHTQTMKRNREKFTKMTSRRRRGGAPIWDC